VLIQPDQKTADAPKSPPLPADAAFSFTINDAAKRTGVSRATLYRMMRDGQLRTVLVRGRRLVPSDALRELFAA
jgi:excisionase family DNA binding protein